MAWGLGGWCCWHLGQAAGTGPAATGMLLHSPGRPWPPPHPLQGAIPKISDLPAPWGTKPATPAEPEQLASWGYLPARYPQGWTPLKDVDAAA